MWIIFACYSGNGSKSSVGGAELPTQLLILFFFIPSSPEYVNKFLSAKPFVFISRISFALHFVHFIVLNSVSAKTRAVGHFEVSNFVSRIKSRLAW